jgi:hypothetical protein
MALFINETTSSVADLISKLNTFLTTAGGGNPAWTADRHVPASGEWAISKAALGTNTHDIQVAFQWDTTSPRHLAIYQYDHASGAGNYNAGRAGPWDQDNDSGNGAASTSDAAIDDARMVDLTGGASGPLQYWAFVTVSPVEAVHIVVQTTASKYVHFGFGELQKFNDWNGGAYAYGMRMQGTATTDTAVQTGSTHLLDGIAKDGAAPNPTNGMELFMATIHCHTLPQQLAAGKWAIVGGPQVDTGKDRQSNGGGTDTDRTNFAGGFRANQFAYEFGQALASPDAGFVPGYPIAVFYWHQSPSTVYGPMGMMVDVRGINIGDFAPEQEIVIGSDTWVVFPSHWKTTSTLTALGTVNQGIMYKKN